MKKSRFPFSVFRVPSCDPERNTEDGTRETRGRGAAGFTLIEVMVAVLVSAVLFGICVAIYIRVNRYKSRSEELLFLHENARGILSRIDRDIGGLYVSDSNADGTAQLTDYWQLEPGAMGTAGDRLTFLTAAENPGKLDYCTVQYYVEGGKLYRQLSGTKGGSPPGAGWPGKAESVLSEDVEKLLVTTVPASPAAAELPASITLTLQVTDEGGRPAYRRFTVTVRPGSEEN